MSGSPRRSLPSRLAGRPSLVALFAGVAAIVALDQVTKAIIVRTLAIGESRTIIDGLLRISHVRNHGAAFGLLSAVPWLVTVAALIGVTIAVIVMIRTPSPLVAYGAALVVAGAAGNLADRAFRDFPFRGSVVDFIDFRYWPAFNVADMAVTTGVVLLLVASFVLPDGTPDKRGDDQHEQTGDERSRANADDPGR